MPTTMPPPAPLLDGAPPSPDGISAGKPKSLSFQALQPQVDLGGDVQVVQLAMETAAAVGKGLDLLSQMFPQFKTLSASMQMQLKEGVKTALEQGLSATPEPSAPQMPAQQAPAIGNTLPVESRITGPVAAPFGSFLG